MSLQSLQIQQEALLELRSHLESFKDELNNQMERYRNIVERLHESGLAEEVYRTYLGSYYETDRNLVNQLIAHMDQADTPYVNNNLHANFENQLAANTGWDY